MILSIISACYILLYILILSIEVLNWCIRKYIHFYQLYLCASKEVAKLTTRQKTWSDKTAFIKCTNGFQKAVTNYLTITFGGEILIRLKIPSVSN